MYQPLVSIVTATLNSERYLRQTIESVIYQDYAHIEYIVVDGASTDGTLDIINQYATHITRWVSEPDECIADAFNKGIRMATGEIIGIVSSDDYLWPGALTHVVAAYQAHPDVDVIYGNAVCVDSFTDRLFIVKPDSQHTIWRHQSVKHAATFVTRKAYERFGLYELNRRHTIDYELILRFYVNGARFVYVDQPLAAFRPGGDADRNVYATICNVRDISIQYGYSPLKAYPVYWGKILKLLVRRFIQNVGLTELVILYRRYSGRFVEMQIRDGQYS